MSLDEASLREIVASGEDSTNQFKSDIRSAESLASEMAAFANTEGGVIYLGVKDDGSIPGLSRNEVGRINQLISNSASIMVRSPLTVHTENVLLQNGNIVIVLTVPKGIDKPYFDKNGVIWLKTGSDKRRINSKEELRRQFQLNHQFHADELPTKAGIDKLDKLRFRDFLRDVYQLDYPESIGELMRLLQNMNLATDTGVLNLASVLMFAERPEWIAPQFVVKLIRYPGNTIHSTTYIDAEDCAGPLRKVYDDSQAFIMRNLRKIQVGRSVNSPSLPEIPHTVIEELLVNALVHRDYLVNAPIRIFIFDNRIEIISPGHLPNNLTVEKIMAGNSNIRNPILVSYVAKGLLPYHGLGSGITRALSEWPHIEFIDDQDGCLFKAIVHRKAGFVQEDVPSSPESSSEAYPVYPEGSPKIHHTLFQSPAEYSSGSAAKIGDPILQLVRVDPRITTEQMGAALGITKRAVLKRIGNLKKKGSIRRVGPNKGGWWEVME